jgi:acyl-CoA synthetase (AMP-forming)/AMP-acid ligase II/acyl carrier protein
MPQIVRLKGTLDSALLQSVFRSLISHYEILRTRIGVVSEVPVQYIDDYIDFNIEEYTCSESEIAGILSSFIRPFDLEKGPLLRVCVLHLSETEHILAVDMHHIITDGVSNGILLHSFMSLYRGESLPALSVHYKDYSEWQQSSEHHSSLELHKKFWLDQFKGEIPVIDLPTDYSRPLVKRYEGDKVGFALSSEQTERLKKLSGNAGGTMFMTTLSLYYILLKKLTGQDDLVIGTPVSGRDHVDLEHQVGMFVNTLALRANCNGNESYTEFLNRVKSMTLDCFGNQLYQYESLLEDLKVARDTARNPLFDVMFSYQNFEEPELSMGDLIVSSYSHDHVDAKFDISLTVSEDKDQLFLSFEYSTNLFKRESIERFAKYFQNIVDAVTADSEIIIKEIQMLPTSEKDIILDEFNDSFYPFTGHSTVLDLLSDRVAEFSESTALIFGESEMSYSRFWDSSLRYGNYLRTEYGVNKGDLVGVLLERSEEMLLSLYGILCAGCAYVPIDINLPASRIEKIIEDSGIRVLVSRGRYVQDSLSDLCNVMDLDEVSASVNSYPVVSPVSVEGSDLAYVIYTSGSTGNPKGVMIEHGSLLNLVQSMDHRYPLQKGERYLLKTLYSFDVSVAELFGWFHRGGSLVILGQDMEKNSVELVRAVRDYEISHINFVPSMFGVFMDTFEDIGKDSVNSLQYIFLAGEVFPLEMLHKFKSYDLPAKIQNLYGPTETTVYSCGYNTDNWSSLDVRIPIGRALDNMGMYVLDSHHHLQPIGIWGELCVGGLGVARGYLNNISLSSEKFITVDWLDSGRLYKTGDIGRWLSDGTLEIMGRLDHQVKLRGFRIELGEIESKILGYAGVSGSVVVLKEIGGDAHLVGYYTSEKSIPSSSLRDYLQSELPEYMVPQYYVHLDSFPLTSSGKISRNGLPDVDISSHDPHIDVSNEIEERLLAIWSEVLGISGENISATKSFFELGGHSLKAMMLINKINKQIGIEISLKDVFHNTNIQLMAKVIESQQWLRSQKEDKNNNVKSNKIII